MKRKKLGEVLRDHGKLSRADLDSAIAEQKGKLLRLGELLLDRGLVSKDDLAVALEEVSHVPYVDCVAIVAEPDALNLIPRDKAERYCALPIQIEKKRLVVAMAEPQDLRTLDDLQFITGLQISPRLSFRTEIREAIARHYSDDGTKDPAPATLLQDMTFTEVEFLSTSSRLSNQQAIREMQADLSQKKTPAVRLVSEVIQVAMAKHASDIHIEPCAANTVVRIRVDGVLRDLQSIAGNLQASLISRIKILSDMDISERRTPQDGRFMVAIGRRHIDLRVSTLPTQYGEKVVLRLLETSGPLCSFEDLGVPNDLSKTLSELLSMPQGMILVTGPTGSGKSTTLYSALHKLRAPSVNIVTVEDPVEYILPGINQSHVNTKAGLTFASCLRSILRQDPNIIMVGEIRDRETAEIAMKAAQTGHLVLSTLHTNDSVSAITRLLDLGIPSFLISSSVTGVLAQRLVRKLCSCHSVVEATAEFKSRLIKEGVSELPETMSVPVGCDKCEGTGYKGRVGIYELLYFDEPIRMILRTNGRTDQILEDARRRGMRSMQEDALDKLHLGLTSLEEILRVVPFESSHRAPSQESKVSVPDSSRDLEGQQRRKKRLTAILKRGLPPFPNTVLRLTSVLSGPSADVKKAGKLIRTDPSFSAQILRLCNSPMFGLRSRVLSIEQATVLLGTERLRSLALSCAVMDYAGTGLPPEQAEQFSRHSFLAALLTERLATEMRYCEKEQAYIAGLLHDVGQIPQWMLAVEEKKGSRAEPPRIGLIMC
jgi:type IV pilus assembly protein PilB